MPGHPFGRDCRLLTAKDYAEAFDARKTLRGLHFVVHFRRNGLDAARLGLVIPKKQARTAVLRNAIKRQARELFRQQRQKVPPVDVVLRLAKAGDWHGHAAETAYRRAWREEIQGLLDRLGQLELVAPVRS